MRLRPSARLLVVDPEGRLLLMHVQYRRGPMAGERFWATPGGGLDPGETYEEAAVRELFEETGFRIDHPGPQVHRREVAFPGPEGEPTLSDERYFRIEVPAATPSRDGWTELERELVTEQRWWTVKEIGASTERFWPADLAQLLATMG